MSKRKLKKNVKKKLIIFLITAIILIIGIKGIIKYIEKKNYEKTYEYKLITKGYKKEDANKLENCLSTTDLDNILLNDYSTLYLDIINDKYFIYNNYNEYLEYATNNDIEDIRKVVEKVNVKTNHEYYEGSSKTNTELKELMLVNKYYYLDEDYEPNNLVTINTSYSWGEYGTQKIAKDTYDAYLEMLNGAKEYGYTLMVSSSYRTYSKQKSVYDDYAAKKGEEYADTIAARPGYSEHQTGYALDIFELHNTNQFGFKDTEVYKWLKDNSYKYGFILRYPEDKEDITGYSFESWHYRYVGKDVAKSIYNSNITFDEYYEYYLNK